MSGCADLCYYLPGNVVFAVVGLVYMNVQLEYELSSSTRLRTITEVWKKLT